MRLAIQQPKTTETNDLLYIPLSALPSIPPLLVTKKKPQMEQKINFKHTKKKNRGWHAPI
jgi:hypothetical protein